MIKKWRSVAAFLLVCLLMAVAPGFAVAAEAAGNTYRLKVRLATNPTADEVEKAHVVVDLYEVAVQGEDGRYTLTDSFAGLTLPESSADPDTWDAFAQAAARVVLPEEGEPLAPAQTQAMSDAIVRFELPDAGMYLLIAHGENLTNYVTETADGRLATRAASTSKVYTYLPQVVTVPVLGTVYMKPASESEVGDLEIVKTLTGYVPGQVGTFVFDVEAELDGKNVYSNVVSITFTEPGTQTALVEGVPVGSNVTVTEVYTGASYRLTTEKTQTTVIDGMTTPSVAFTNEAVDGNRGGAITNEFTYDETNGWAWTPVPDTP